jgi:hypothetical protein
MAETPKVEWTGANGRKYTYWVYTLPTNLSSDQNGNYIYAKSEEGYWQPLYIGQGDLGDRTDIEQYHQSSCLKRKGATHVHAHKNERKADRLAEEDDLLRNHPEAFQPAGCNEKRGG